MRRVLFLAVLALVGVGGGCAGIKSVEEGLTKAAALASGPCGQKIAEAAVICRAQSVAPAAQGE
jgi:hypothetical protein